MFPLVSLTVPPSCPQCPHRVVVSYPLVFQLPPLPPVSFLRPLRSLILLSLPPSPAPVNSTLSGVWLIRYQSYYAIHPQLPLIILSMLSLHLSVSQQSTLPTPTHPPAQQSTPMRSSHPARRRSLISGSRCPRGTESMWSSP